MKKKGKMKEKKKQKTKVSKVLSEFKAGELHAGSKKGPIVKSKAQALAIGLNEQRKAGTQIPKKRK